MPREGPHFPYQLAGAEDRAGNDSTLTVDKLRRRVCYEVRPPTCRVLEIRGCKAVVNIEDQIAPTGKRPQGFEVGDVQRRIRRRLYEHHFRCRLDGCLPLLDRRCDVDIRMGDAEPGKDIVQYLMGRSK